jgi:streptogramin lyase
VQTNITFYSQRVFKPVNEIDLLGKKNLTTVVLLLVLGLFGGKSAGAEGLDRGKMRVDFLYSIETTGGRGEQLRAPQDIFFDRKAQELYVTDPGNRGILVYNASGAFLDKITMEGKEGSPTMVAADGEGRLYVGHNNSAKVSVLTFRGEPLEVLDVPGIVDLPGNQNRPQYFAQGPDGKVITLKTQGGLVKLDPFGEGHEEIRLGGENAPNMIYGMTIDARGRFLFSDMRPYSVVIFDPVKETFQRFGSAGILYGQLARPQGLAADEAGHIFVTSLVRNKVLCYDAEGNFIEEFGSLGRNYGQFYMPSKIVSDGKDRIYVLEPPLKRIQVFRIAFPPEESMPETVGKPPDS